MCAYWECIIRLSFRYTLTDNDYAFKAIEETDFVAGIAIAQKDKKYLNIKQTQDTKNLFDKGIQALYVEPLPTPPTPPQDGSNSTNATDIVDRLPQPDNFTYVEISPWEYCAKLSEKLRAPGGVKKPLTAQQLHALLNLTESGEIEVRFDWFCCFYAYK